MNSSLSSSTTITEHSTNRTQCQQLYINTTQGKMYYTHQANMYYTHMTGVARNQENGSKAILRLMPPNVATTPDMTVYISPLQAAALHLITVIIFASKIAGAGISLRTNSLQRHWMKSTTVPHRKRFGTVIETSRSMSLSAPSSLVRRSQNTLPYRSSHASTGFVRSVTKSGVTERYVNFDKSSRKFKTRSS